MNFLPASILVDRVLAHAPNCPRPLAAQTVLDAARGFCESTSVHKEPSDQLVTFPGIMVYEFDSPSSETVIARLEGLTHKAVITRNVVELLSDPGSSKLSATLVLKPAYSSKKLASLLIDHYQEAIAAGALARLLKIPGSAWADFGLASMYQSEYASHIHNTRMQVEQPSIVQIPKGFL